MSGSTNNTLGAGGGRTATAGPGSSSTLYPILLWYATRWADELAMEQKFGVPTANSMAFQGEDIFGQVLMSLKTGMFGNGGKGSGFDLSDRKECAAEIKTVCRCQPWRCKECKSRSPWTSEVCVKCGGDRLERMKDTRFGISAAAHMKFKDQLKMYYMVTIDHFDGDAYDVRAWEIDCSNEYFQRYIEEQYENGGPTVNCLPGSFDFHMSGPTRILFARLLLGSAPGVSMIDETRVVESVPVSCMRSNEKDLVKEAIVDECVAYEIAKEKLVLRIKSHGKPRGDTTRHL